MLFARNRMLHNNALASLAASPKFVMQEVDKQIGKT
jgi:hypothetical protein